MTRVSAASRQEVEKKKMMTTIWLSQSLMFHVRTSAPENATPRRWPPSPYQRTSACSVRHDGQGKGKKGVRAQFARPDGSRTQSQMAGAAWQSQSIGVPQPTTGTPHAPPARHRHHHPRGPLQLSSPATVPPPTRSLGGWVGPPPTPPPATVAAVVAPPSSRSPLLHAPPPAVATGRGERAAPVAAQPELRMAETSREDVRMGDTGGSRGSYCPGGLPRPAPSRAGAVGPPKMREVFVSALGVCVPSLLDCGTTVGDGPPWPPHCCCCYTKCLLRCIGNVQLAAHSNQRRPLRRGSVEPPPSRCRGGPTHHCGRMPPPPGLVVRMSLSVTDGRRGHSTRPAVAAANVHHPRLPVHSSSDASGGAASNSRRLARPGTSTGKAATHTQNSPCAHTTAEGLPASVPSSQPRLPSLGKSKL